MSLGTTTSDIVSRLRLQCLSAPPCLQLLEGRLFLLAWWNPGAVSCVHLLSKALISVTCNVTQPRDCVRLKPPRIAETCHAGTTIIPPLPDASI